MEKEESQEDPENLVMTAHWDHRGNRVRQDYQGLRVQKEFQSKENEAITVSSS